MPTFHVIQRIVHEETIVVEAENAEKALSQVEAGDGETIESEPVDDPTLVRVDCVDEVPGYVVESIHGGTDVGIRNARVCDKADEIFGTHAAAKTAARSWPGTPRVFDFSE